MSEAFLMKLPNRDGHWKVTEVGKAEMEFGELCYWVDIVEKCVKESSGFNYRVDTDTFRLSVGFLNEETGETLSLSTKYTLAEQNNRFFLFLTPDDEDFDERYSFVLDSITDDTIIGEIFKRSFKDNPTLYDTFEERKNNYREHESFSGVRSYRRLQKLSKGLYDVTLVRLLLE